MRIRRLTAEPVTSNRAELGEGPVWDDTTSRLVWVDITGKRILSTDPSTGSTESVDAPSQVGAVGLVKSGGFVAALEDGLYLEGPSAGAADGDVEQWLCLAPIEPHDATTRMNDGKCDPTGAFVGGTMARDGREGTASLYRIDPSGAVQRLLSGLTISNGLAWTADGAAMYHIDTPTRTVMRYAYDPSAVPLTAGRSVVEIPKSHGFPDGMTLDADGCLWVAFWEGHSVRRYTPEGVLDAIVDLPVGRVTACAFGGPNLDTLFITTAVAEAGDGADEPEAGALFAAAVGVAGHLPYRFGGTVADS